MDPYSLWVGGDYQRAGGLDIAVPGQQSAMSISSNVTPAANQQQADTDFSTQFALGAPRARHRCNIIPLLPVFAAELNV